MAKENVCWRAGIIRLSLTVSVVSVSVLVLCLICAKLCWPDGIIRLSLTVSVVSVSVFVLCLIQVRNSMILWLVWLFLASLVRALSSLCVFSVVGPCGGVGG